MNSTPRPENRPEPHPDHRPRHRRLALVGSIIGAVIVALDGTVLTIAQPSLQRDLGASFVQVQWTSTGYLIAVASLLVFAGRLGDRYGHQRIFALGILGFGAASAGIALAPDVYWVIGLRIVQGIFGALLQPATLGMLRATYPPDELGMPIALRTSAIGLAAAAGPVIGGALTARLGWQSVFLLNVAPALVIGVLALLVRIPTPRQTAVPTRLDLPGACLLATALACLVHTLVGIPESGWTATTVLGLVAMAAAGIAFVRHERRTPSPLVPPAVLGSPTVASALGILLAASAAMFGALFIGTYFLQDILALDPLQSGLRVLPLAAMMVLSAPASAVLQRRHGPRRTTAAAMTLLALGILLLSRLDQSSPTVAISGGFLLLGAGFGTVMVTATAVIVRHAPVAHAGVAGGLQQTAMNIGPALGVAAATVLMTVTAPGDAAGRPAHGNGPHWSGPAFTAAMGTTLTAFAAVAAIGALLAVRLPGRTARRTAEPAEPSSATAP
ncbi:MFS transporter [Streptomyces sp. NPDC053427]|uniref:MFS transporter n=1 Tax=Streptomyces sp. NPDC053427 TaxID=3365701 RepID=UPI0037D21BC9